MRVYSVTEFNREINTLLTDITVCLQGEVSDFKVAQNRFVWFDLKDQKSKVSCFLLAFNLKVQLVDGLEIQVIGSPGLFLKSGRFYFQVKEIKLVGAGALKKQYELLKKKLAQEGLFSAARKRPLPRFPQRIGLITSPAAAAYTDVLKILKNRWAGLEIILFPTVVQGPTAVSQILAAFQRADQLALDVIILTRGGGSAEDLQAFNEEQVCRAVFSSKTPVVSAVGHERDITLVDYVADVRAATPSNAAELAVPYKKDVLFQIDTLLEKQERSLHFFTEKVDHALSLLQSYNPQNVLRRGYSLTTFRGRLVQDSQAVPKNAIIETRLAKGKIKSKKI